VDVDLDVTLREQIVLFGSYEGIDIEYRRAGEMVGETYHIFAPKSQMIRVFVNLLTNAVQALEPSVLTSSARGRIYVTLTKYTADQDSAWGIPGVRYVRVDVEDNGPGVSLENRSKLFTPKFTTKNSGSGLGLAICKSVVEQIGGTIIYSTSEELGGADFRVIVPESISA
jgi:signal transduction histidine kinase